MRSKQVVKSISPLSQHLLDQKSLIFTRSDPCAFVGDVIGSG